MAKTTPLRRQNLSDTIAARLRATIAGGDLTPGTRLAGHRDLARQYEVSVGSVREAVRLLTAEGLVEVHPGKGTFVAATGAAATFRSATLSASDIHDLLEARKVIEARVAELAAERADEEQREAIRGAFGRMAAAIESPEAFVEADLELHLTVAAAANNRYLHQILYELRDLLRDDMRLSVETAFRRTGTLGPSLALHRGLAERILERDPEGAAQAAVAIVERNEQFVMGLYAMVESDR